MCTLTSPHKNSGQHGPQRRCLLFKPRGTWQDQLGGFECQNVQRRSLTELLAVDGDRLMADFRLQVAQRQRMRGTNMLSTSPPPLKIFLRSAVNCLSQLPFPIPKHTPLQSHGNADGSAVILKGPSRKHVWLSFCFFRGPPK